MDREMNDEATSDCHESLMLDTEKATECGSKESTGEATQQNTKKTSSRRKGKSYKCTKCPFETDKRPTLTKHKATHKDKGTAPKRHQQKKHKCPKCEYSSKSLPELLVHEKKHVLRQCPDCPVICEQRNFAKHRAEHCKLKPHLCSLCGKQYTSASGLKSHMLTHSGLTRDKPVKCDQCSYSCDKLMELSLHQRSHTGIKPFKCPKPKCAFACTRQHGLKQHIGAVHEDLRPYICTYCGRGFHANSVLKGHILTHTGEKRFHCSICEYSCVNMHSIKNHYKKHRGELPNRCKLCDFSCPSPSGLVIHMRTHTGEKPYLCTKCGKGLTSSNSLKVHLMNHAGEKPFKCTICNKYASVCMPRLKEHQERMHNIKPKRELGDSKAQRAKARVTPLSDTVEARGGFLVDRKTEESTAHLSAQMQRENPRVHYSYPPLPQSVLSDAKAITTSTTNPTFIAKRKSGQSRRASKKRCTKQDTVPVWNDQTTEYDDIDTTAQPNGPTELNLNTPESNDSLTKLNGSIAEPTQPTISVPNHTPDTLPVSDDDDDCMGFQNDDNDSNDTVDYCDYPEIPVTDFSDIVLDNKPLSPTKSAVPKTDFSDILHDSKSISPTKSAVPETDCSDILLDNKPISPVKSTNNEKSATKNSLPILSDLSKQTETKIEPEVTVKQEITTDINSMTSLSVDLVRCDTNPSHNTAKFLDNDTKSQEKRINRNESENDTNMNHTEFNTYAINELLQTYKASSECVVKKELPDETETFSGLDNVGSEERNDDVKIGPDCDQSPMKTDCVSYADKHYTIVDMKIIMKPGLSPAELLKARRKLRHPHGTVHQCPLCLYKVKDFVIFKRHIECHGDARPFPCPVSGCGYAGKQAQSLASHMHTHRDEKLFKCKVPGCEYSGKRARLLASHMHTHLDEKLFKCRVPGCEYAGKRAQLLASHMKSHGEQRRFICEVPGCGYAGNRAQCLASHTKHVHNNPREIDSNTNSVFLCPECQQPFQKRIYMTSHIISEHPDLSYQYQDTSEQGIENEEPNENTENVDSENGNAKYPISESEAQSPTTSDADKCNSNEGVGIILNGSEPQGRENPNKLLPKTALQSSPLCGQFCSSATDLTDQAMIRGTGNNVKKPIQCKQCGFMAKTRNNLNRHIINIHSHPGTKKINKASKVKTYNLTIYKCVLCRYETHAQTLYKLHIRTHVKDGRFHCDIAGCEYIGKSYGNFRSHMKKRHRNVDPDAQASSGCYLCPNCGKTLSCKWSLEQHILRHSDVKPFTCDQCGRGFLTNGELKMHVRTHTDEKRFSCHLCPYRCITSTHLKRHMKTHNDMKPYKCSYCEYSCRLPRALKSHIRRQHFVSLSYSDIREFK